MSIKLAIAIPTTGSIKTNTFTSVVKMLKRAPFEWIVITQTSSVLHESRNILVNRAIKEGCSHLLFIDSDMFFEPDSLERLLSRDKDIVGAIYNTKQLPLISTAKKEAEGFEIWEKVG